MANANQPPVTFEQISSLFGIKDMNPSIIVPQDANVFSTNVFIPMEGKIDHKTYFYLSGMVKLVETFRARIDNSGLKDQGWMLFIYYDSMFDESSSYNNSKYIPNKNNEYTNKLIKKNYSDNKEQLKRLLQLYKRYLHIIRKNVDGKYSFVKLYSFNCTSITSKEKGYLGHPSTFGSIVRFLPLFDPQIKRMFCINISHAISPRLCYLINEWVKSGKLLLTSGLKYYRYDYDTNYDKLSILKELLNKQYLDLFNLELFKPRIPAGLFGFYKNENIQILDDRYKKFFYSITRLIEYSKTTLNVFAYGIDELLLGYLFEKMNTENIENILFYKIKYNPYDKSFLHVFPAYKDKYEKILQNIGEPEKLKILKKKSAILRSISEFMISIQIPKADDVSVIIPIHIKHDYIFNSDYALHIKYMVKIKQFIDEYIKFVLSQITNKDGKLIGEESLTYEENNNIINFLKLYLKKVYCDGYDKGKCIEMYKDKKFMKQLKGLDLYQNDLLYYISPTITQFGILSRYTSRTFMSSIGQNESIKKTLGEASTDISGLNILLDSYDEEKPLIINSKNDTDYYYDFVKNFPEYFTFMDTNNPRLLCELIEYYRDPLKVLPVPYEMQILQVGGKSKRRTLKKSKPKHIKRKTKTIK